MDDYADVYYVDTRNADPRDHRTGSSTTVRPTGRPVTTIYAPGSGGRPMPYAQQAPIYYQAPQPSATAALFGKLTTGQVVDMVAQLFAMLQTLPSAPVATRDAGTDVANLIMLCRARHYMMRFPTSVAVSLVATGAPGRGWSAAKSCATISTT